MNDLAQINGRHPPMRPECTYNDDKMDTLITEVRNVGAKFDGAMLSILMLVVKGLLATVCVIAVGGKASEMAQSIWGQKTTTTSTNP